MEDPSRSFATILDLNGESELAYVGQRIGEHRLRRVASDRVFFRKGDERCQMRLGEDEHVRKKRPNQPAARRKAATRKRAGTRPQRR
jgi:hypothetical protein